MNCSTPCFPTLHHPPGHAQAHVYWFGDAIQPSGPLLSLSPPALNLSQDQVFFFCLRSRLFASSSRSIGALASASVLLMNIQDWFPLGLTGLVSCSSKDTQESYPTPEFKSMVSYVALSLLMVQLSHPYMSTAKNSFDCTDLCQQSNASAF